MIGTLASLARSASSSAERGEGSEGPDAAAGARWRGKELRQAAQDEVPVPTVAAPRLGAEKRGFGAGEDTGRHLSVGRGGLGGAGERRSDRICRREEEEEHRRRGSLPVTGFLFLSDSLLGDKKARVGTSVQTLVDVATISHFSILYLPVDRKPNTIGTCNFKKGYLKTNHIHYVF